MQVDVIVISNQIQLLMKWLFDHHSGIVWLSVKIYDAMTPYPQIADLQSGG